MELSARIVDDASGLSPLRAGWDALATELRRPFAGPAWPLAWWEHLRPAGTGLRLVVVEDGEELVAVLPFCVLGRTYRPLGGGLAPVEPLARPGAENAAAAAAAAALAGASPRPWLLELEQHGNGPDWAEMLAHAWPGPGRPWRYRKEEAPVPCVDLGPGFDPWMSAKSGSFRRDVRRNGRKLVEEGGSFRFATAESVERDIGDFLSLHRARLAEQGGTSLPDVGIDRMLTTVAAEMMPAARFRLLCLELDGRTIAAQLLLTAGEEVSAWNSGFDAAFAAFSPSMQCLLNALEDAAGRGERTMSLGPGGQSYKYRLADGEDRIVKSVLVPPGPAYPLMRVRSLPRRLRKAVAARLPPDLKRRLRDLFRR